MADRMVKVNTFERNTEKEKIYEKNKLNKMAEYDLELTLTLRYLTIAMATMLKTLDAVDPIAA